MFTPKPWGMTKLPIVLPDGKPIGGDTEGFMITSPGYSEEVQRWMREKEYPITSTRIAILEVSPYMSLKVAEENARLMCAAQDLLAACEEALPFVLRAVEAAVKVPGFKPEDHKLAKKIQWAIAKARGET